MSILFENCTPKHYHVCYSCQNIFDTIEHSTCPACLGKQTPGNVSGYYQADRGDGKSSGAAVSRDDKNRRIRESRLGFASPSDDWSESGCPVICIFAGQTVGPTVIKKFHDARIKRFYHYQENRYGRTANVC